MATGDSHTRTTQYMLDALAQNVHFDGTEGDDTVTVKLEQRISELTGCQAALFVLSSTMANLMALKALSEAPTSSLICDERARIVRTGTAGLADTGVRLVQPSNGLFLTANDIQSSMIPRGYPENPDGNASPL
jgi:threonine aldolase